jgi:tetratricopeptide (TPR) repeat protein
MRLAALDSLQHKELTEEAAELFAATGDFVRARAAAERLMATHPFDVAAVSCASSVVLTACDADTAAIWLQRALDAWTSNRSTEPRLAELWRRLGDAERSRNRKAEAKVAYERAIAIGREAPEAVAARRALMELTPKTARTIESLELLVEADQLPDDVIALARAFVAADRVDDARATFDLARALGVELAREDEQFLVQTAPRPMAFDEGYGSTLDDGVRRDAIDTPADGPLGAVLDVVGEAFSLVAPDPTTALCRAGIGEATRLSAKSYAAVVALYPQISKALGGPQTLLYTSADSGDYVRVVLSSPPVVEVGAEMAAVLGVDVTPPADATLRFKLGRAVELARARRIFAMGTDREAFRLLVDGLWCACGARSEQPADPAVADEAKRLHSVLPIALRRRIGELLADVPRDTLDVDAYIGVCERAADCSGLLACGNVAGAIAARPEASAHLVRFAASRRYRLARRRLRTRVR